MADTEYDTLLNNYTHAVDHWVATIRAEEALALPDHTMKQMEAWDTAALAQHDAERSAKNARELYKSALRQKNYGF